MSLAYPLVKIKIPLHGGAVDDLFRLMTLALPCLLP